ncbi:hypothetical protein BDR26DRAFT_921728 [Obelidium mucronatum]|nr:hypothetical protein BDR26DRAFT_921728 [Obelidium mucronatum]
MQTERELLRLTKKDLAKKAALLGLNIEANGTMKKDTLVAAILSAQKYSQIQENESQNGANEERGGGEDCDLDSLSRLDLVKLAKSLNLKQSGKKSELIERILAAQLKQEEHDISEADKIVPEAVPPLPTLWQSKFFCCIGRTEFSNDDDDDVSAPGFAVLKSGIVLVVDNKTKQEIRLNIPIRDEKICLPEGFTDNIVCRLCITKNTAAVATAAAAVPATATSSLKETPNESLTKDMLSSLAHPNPSGDSFSFSFHTPLTSTPLNNSPRPATTSRPLSASTVPTRTTTTTANEIIDDDAKNDFLNELSMISTTADEVLAALDGTENNKVDVPTRNYDNTTTTATTSTTSSLAPISCSSPSSSSAIPIISKSLRETMPSPIPKKPIHSSNSHHYNQQQQQQQHRKSIKQPLSITLAQRRMSAKILNSTKQQQQLAREKKVTESRLGVRSCASAATATLDSANTSFSGSSGSCDSSFSAANMSTVTSSSSSSSTNCRLKLPAPAKERKARGEVLWKAPPKPLVTGETAGVAGAVSVYVPKEDAMVANAVDAILQNTERGSMEEWNMIVGGRRAVVQRSP